MTPRQIARLKALLKHGPKLTKADRVEYLKRLIVSKRVRAWQC